MEGASVGEGEKKLKSPMRGLFFGGRCHWTVNAVGPVSPVRMAQTRAAGKKDPENLTLAGRRQVRTGIP